MSLGNLVLAPRTTILGPPSRISKRGDFWHVLGDILEPIYVKFTTYENKHILHFFFESGNRKKLSNTFKKFEKAAFFKMWKISHTKSVAVDPPSLPMVPPM